MKTESQKREPQNPVEVTEVIQNLSFPVLRCLGYVLLIFSLIDYIAILVPPQLTNPAWEFQSMGQMVDHIWSILLGLAFVFVYGKGNIIRPSEIAVLKLLSWFSLLLGIIYILMLPLGINNSLTLYKNINNQFLAQQGQQQEQIQKVTERIKSVNSAQELNNLARILNIPNENISSQSTQELKKQLSQQIQKAAENSAATATATKKMQIKSLIKNAVRINLGAIISGVFLIIIWNMTGWIRSIDKNIR